MRDIYEPRWYRRQMTGDRFACFTITYLETDLWIGIDPSSYSDAIPEFILSKIKEIRSVLDQYIARNPIFLSSLSPLKLDDCAHPFIKTMIRSSSIAGIGPMSRNVERSQALPFAY
jgi:ApbE superfamily uncharacterized protein (UPF0280 family)